jgi:predicted P-loop ATPase
MPNADPIEAGPVRDAHPQAGVVTIIDDDDVAATVTPGIPTVTEFMSAVIAWPGSPNDPGYVNLHYSMPNPTPTPNKPLLKGMGWPYKDIDSFMKRVAWINSVPHKFKDVWFCTSLQSRAGKNERGKPRAERRAANALKQKAIWVDIDVGENDPKKYRTVEEALKALRIFRATCGFPPPSAIVFSGGGIHVYWISKHALSPLEWAPYANGLKQLLLTNAVKCDAGVTTDVARILRVPGTLNFKSDPPRPVTLAPLPLMVYDFPSQLDFLQQLARQTVAPTAGEPTIWTDGITEAQRDGFRQPSAFKIDEPDLNARIEKHSNQPLDPRSIFKACGFYRDAFATGGKDHKQDLWMYAVLGTIFMENGRVYAHEISKGHATYTPAETDAMFDRKVSERQDLRLGYPQCSTIQGAGCKSCATCPLLAKGKSPLNIRTEFTATVNPIGAPHGPTKPGTVAVKFRDLDKWGRPKATLANAVIAIQSLGIVARLDLFHNRTTVSYNGTSKTIREGLLTDQTVSAVRSLINNTYRIDCGDPNTFAAINEIARDNAYDPVLDLLNHCQGKWDGVPRLDTWAIDYLGCEDTPLNRAIGQGVLVAACRRARVPGCKFDFITVLEGPEGFNKSSAIRVLAGDENFNDQSILGANDKEIQEQLEGTWMHENADLAGMRRADVEQVKAFASRQVDRARPAYGRVREDRPRRSVEWATTNNETYLLSQTGNRRWWTLKTGKIDIEALRRDREQLLGEAAKFEAAGEDIGLDESLWGDARNAQEQRRVTDPWEDNLADLDGDLHFVHRLGDGFERVFTADILTNMLQIPAAQQTSQHTQRLAHAMQHAGWGRTDSGRITIAGVTKRGYIRPDAFNRAQRFAHSKLGISEPPPPPVITGICDRALTGLTP